METRRLSAIDSHVESPLAPRGYPIAMSEMLMLPEQEDGKKDGKLYSLQSSEFPSDNEVKDTLPSSVKVGKQACAYSSS